MRYWEEKYRREAAYVPLWNKSALRRQSFLYHPIYSDAPAMVRPATRSTRSAAQARQQKRRRWCQQFRRTI